VLKRNRTLKVCNLADNRIDVAGLVALAEALKYNSTLDTLDLSSNPCCGPALEGVRSSSRCSRRSRAASLTYLRLVQIHAIRHAFTLNANLSRLLLSATGLTTSGAIALAEFLPEATHLLHLDLTSNPAVETAGIMALAVGLRANKIVRCLDLSVAVGDEVGLGWSRDILQVPLSHRSVYDEEYSLTDSEHCVLAELHPQHRARPGQVIDQGGQAGRLGAYSKVDARPAGQGGRLGPGAGRGGGRGGNAGRSGSGRHL
jgi:hypothetical protein